MRVWQERPIEIAHLFNPAFCGLLMAAGVSGFTERDENGMPYPLSFVLLPIVLHRSTREALPNTLSTKMHPWIQQNQDVRVGFAERCHAISGHIREAVLFAGLSGLISFSADARMKPTKARLKTPAWPAESESAVCFRRARFVGSWLANAGEVGTVFAMWGIRP
jgi:hypothetical protein